MLPEINRLESLDLAGPIANGARFITDDAPLEVTFHAPGILRLKFGADDRADYGLLAGKPEPAQVGISEQGAGYRVAAGPLALEIQPGPLRVRFIDGDRVLLDSTTDGHISNGYRVAPFGTTGDGGWWAAFELHTGEPVYGLGEKWGRLDRRGQLLESFAVDALGVNGEDSYKNTPFAWSPGGWGVFVHTTAPVSHGVGHAQWSHRSYAIKLADTVLDLFLLAAGSPAQMLERYTYLTGRAPAIPRWSYGAWLSRCYYHTPDELLDAARGMRDRGLPCDVITLDGRAWLKVDTRFLFEWDPDRYPDPRGFCDEVKSLGYRLCVWEYPYVSVRNSMFRELAERGYFLKDETGNTHVFDWEPATFGSVLKPLPPSAALDFTNPEAYAWWAEKHRDLFEVGVDVIKTDFGEHIAPDTVGFNGETGRRLHNVYPLLYNRCVYEATEKWGPSGPLVWGRAGWTGSQRYPVQWGGDPQGDWEGLAASIRGCLSWGLSGAPFCTFDIGGFYDLHRGRPTPEFYVRSTQAGVLTSHTRFHGQSPREPWEFGEEAENVVRQWLELRYRLIPYLEQCAQEASQTGMPVMRAMPLAFPEDQIAWAFEEQYMFGPALLVAPVLAEDGRVRFYLPAGRWTDFWTGEQVQGPCTVETRVAFDRIPVYGREGTSLPLGPVVQRTDDLPVPTPIIEVRHF